MNRQQSFAVAYRQLDDLWIKEEALPSWRWARQLIEDVEYNVLSVKQARAALYEPGAYPDEEVCLIVEPLLVDEEYRIEEGRAKSAARRRRQAHEASHTCLGDLLRAAL